MAKTDSFFIRKSINIGNDLNFYETSIDLGAYVDALGKAVLRIHNIAVQYSDIDGRTCSINGSTNGTSCSADFQLTTQTQSDMVVTGDNKSVVASGRLSAYAFGTSGTVFPSIVSNDMDLAPQHWTRGYLIGVEQLYLGGAATDGWQEDMFVSIVLECQSETLTKEAAMALALSQQ